MSPYLTSRLQRQLKIQKVPYPLVRGPERLQSSARSETHIVLERDDIAGDSWAPPRSRNEIDNATLLRQQTISMRFTIYGQATTGGATTEEHEDEIDRITKQLIRALFHVMAGRPDTDPPEPHYEWREGRGGFLTKAQLEQLKLMDWPGRVYVLPWSYDVGIYDQDYDGTPPESVIVGPDDVPVETTLDIGEEPGPPKGTPTADTEIEEA